MLSKFAPATVATLLATATVFAGWEDVGAPPKRRTGNNAPVTIETTGTRQTAPVAAPAATRPATVTTAAPRAVAAPAASPATYNGPQTVREAAQRRAAARATTQPAQPVRQAPVQPAPASYRTSPTYRAPAPAQPAPSRAPANQPPPQEWRRADTSRAQPEDDYDFASEGNAYFVPFFDAIKESDCWLHAIYITPATAANGNDLTMAEGQYHVRMVDVQDFIGGDLTLDANIKGVGFIDDAEYETLPYVLIEAAVDLEFTWRFISGFSLQLGARPGVYGDPENFDASLFSFPFHGCLYYSFAPEFAIRAGAEVRPGWDMAVMPLAGLAWAPSEYFLLEAGVPRSTAILRLGPFDFYGLAQWDNATYAMEDKDQKPEDLTLESWRLGGGLTINFFDAFRIGGEAGYIMGRKFKAEGSAGEGEIELENSPYFGATLGARF
jgi:hypothetical protein